MRYGFVGDSCLKPSMKKKVEYLSKINLDQDEIDTFYTLIKEEVLPTLAWKVSGRWYPRRRGTCQYKFDWDKGYHYPRILIHQTGQHAECVVHELAHAVVRFKNNVKGEHHGPNFARAFEDLIEMATGVLF